MDTFPYEHHPSMLEAYLPNLSKQTTSSLVTDIGSSSHSFYPSNPLHGSASAGNHLSYSASCNTQEQNKNGTDRKRKNRDQSCTDPAPSKNTNKTQWKKQKKSDASVRGSRERLKSEKDQKTTSQQPPSGYIHVRARRGQATDSHSLAERVRREKISQRMKLLQGLVPGCDKVTGKALMLDEIINYVQSLQNQVEFLSMKLASLSPLFFDLSEDSENQILQSDMWRSLSSPSQSAQQSSYVSQVQIGCLPTLRTPATIALPNHLLENAASVLVPGLKHANGVSTAQDSASLMWEGQHQADSLCYF